LQLRTIHSCGDEFPTLLGRLVMHCVNSGPNRGKPVLAISVWSPWTRTFQEINIPGPTIGLEAVVESVLHCGRPVLVGLNLVRRVDDRKTLAECKASLRRWLVQKSLSEGRPVDRLAVERELTGVA
jgi:hypothetical protein